MQGTTRRRVDQPWLVVLHTLGVLSLLGLALLGQVPAEVAGWLVPPAIPLVQGRARRVRGSPARRGCTHPGRRAAGRAGWRALGDYLLQSWRPVLLRSLLVWGLWVWSGYWGPAWLRLAPWGWWLWRGLGVGWPRLQAQALWRGVEWTLWQGQRLLLVGYLGLALHGQSQGRWGVECLGLGCVVCERDEPWVEVRHGGWQLPGNPVRPLHHPGAGDHPFRVRMLMLFLRLLDAPGPSRRSRRTRDGRTPFVRQVQAAAWFGLPHPDVSRWRAIGRRGAWPAVQPSTPRS